MRAINHDSLLLSLLLQGLLGQLYVFGVKVGTSGATTEDDESVLVTGSSCDSCKALLRDTHEMMLSSSRSDGVNGNSQAAVRAVLEADWERKSRRKLAMQLGLCGACADSSKGDQVSEELWGDSVEHFAGNRHAGRGQVAEELTGHTEALVDLEGLVDIWVVDQPLPAHSRAWLLEVSPHDNAEIAGKLVGESLEALAVLDGSGGVVDGAWAADYEKTVRCTHNDINGILATFNDGLESRLSDGNLRDQ